MTTMTTAQDDRINRIARLLCYEKCRAGSCKERERCCHSYPAPGYSYFEGYIAEAQKLICPAPTLQEEIAKLISRLRLGGPNALEITDESADALLAQATRIAELEAELSARSSLPRA